jgi:ssDNA-binding Zn-finger/Zn-ribbon topoisomerase 1
MTLPRDYDQWRLSGPEEPDEPKMEECPECSGKGMIVWNFGCDKCETCHGTGEVEAEAEEYENERGEWLRDRRDGK